MRYLMLNKPPNDKGHKASALTDELKRLVQEYGGWVELAHSHVQKSLKGNGMWQNMARGGKSERAKQQVADPAVMAQLRSLLAEDIELFEWAREHYEEQWARPLEFCHDRPDPYTGRPLRGMSWLGEYLWLLVAGYPEHLCPPWIDAARHFGPVALGGLIFGFGVLKCMRQRAGLRKESADALQRTRAKNGELAELEQRLGRSGSVALSLCSTADPRYTRLANICGASFCEATTRPNPICRSAQGGKKPSPQEVANALNAITKHNKYGLKSKESQAAAKKDA
jgi:hypothetical protein